MLTAEQLLKIEQDAQNATPGPWDVGMRSGHNANTVFARDGIDQYNDTGICSVYGVNLNRKVDECADNPGMPTAQHIANCDPQTVMELVKMARRYLWFRDPTTTRSKIMEVSKFGTEKMDELVDSAINSQRKERGEG